MDLRIFDHGAKVAASHDLKRSTHWPSASAFRLRQQPTCQACSHPRLLHSIFDHQVHHCVVPFHYALLLGRPDLELDPANLSVLCEPPTLEHHLLLGHLGDFHSYAPNVDELLVKYQDWSASQIKADPAWQKLSASKPPKFGDMTLPQKDAMRARLDARFPLKGLTAWDRILQLVEMFHAAKKKNTG